MVRVIDGPGYNTLGSLRNFAQMFTQAMERRQEEERRQEAQRNMIDLFSHGSGLMGQDRTETYLPSFEPQYNPGNITPQTGAMEKALPPMTSGFNIPGYDPQQPVTENKGPLPIFDFIQRLKAYGDEIGAQPDSTLAAINQLGPMAQKSREIWEEKEKTGDEQAQAGEVLNGLAQANTKEEALPYYVQGLQLGIKGMNVFMDKFEAEEERAGKLARSGAGNVLYDPVTGETIRKFDAIFDADERAEAGQAGTDPLKRTDIAYMEKNLFGDQFIIDGQSFQTEGVVSRYTPISGEFESPEEYRQALANSLNEIQIKWGDIPGMVEKARDMLLSSPRSPFSGGPPSPVEPEPEKESLISRIFGVTQTPAGDSFIGSPTTTGEGAGQPLSWEDYQALLAKGRTDEEIKAAGYAIPKQR